MFKKLLGLFSEKEAPAPAPVFGIVPEEPSLAMTDEMRAALFPKQTRMVSTLFERPAPALRAGGGGGNTSSLDGGQRGFPLL